MCHARGVSQLASAFWFQSKCAARRAIRLGDDLAMGTYAVKTLPSVEHTTALVDKQYIETFHFMKNGKSKTNTTDGKVVTGNNFMVDGLYFIESMPCVCSSPRC